MTLHSTSGAQELNKRNWCVIENCLYLCKCMWNKLKHSEQLTCLISHLSGFQSMTTHVFGKEGKTIITISRSSVLETTWFRTVFAKIWSCYCVVRIVTALTLPGETWWLCGKTETAWLLTHTLWIDYILLCCVGLNSLGSWLQ